DLATISNAATAVSSTKFMEYLVARQSFGLCAGELDYFAPLLGIVSNELAEVGGRAGKYHAPKVGKPCLQLGISEPRIDLPIELAKDPACNARPVHTKVPSAVIPCRYPPAGR